jgi:hypothetical protein
VYFSLRASLLPIAIHESVKCCVPKPIGRNATDGGIVGHESIWLLLRKDSLGVQADACGMDYGSIWRRLDGGRELATTGEQHRGHCGSPQVTLHVGVSRKDGSELRIPKVIASYDQR